MIQNMIHSINTTACIKVSKEDLNKLRPCHLFNKALKIDKNSYIVRLGLRNFNLTTVVSRIRITNYKSLTGSTRAIKR